MRSSKLVSCIIIKSLSVFLFSLIKFTTTSLLIDGLSNNSFINSIFSSFEIVILSLSRDADVEDGVDRADVADGVDRADVEDGVNEVDEVF